MRVDHLRVECPGAFDVSDLGATLMARQQEDLELIREIAPTLQV